ncbi:MAG: WD40 repeat domain-containing serine/threonine protein kinase [Phycisphaerae bacterium]
MLNRCPSPRVLEALAAGDQVDREVQAHLESCDTCREAVADVRENQRFLRSARPALSQAFHTAAPSSAQPRSVAGFELLEEIGRGGQGVVFRALQLDTKRPAAVKMLLSGGFATARQESRFEREIEIAARLRHPGIVSIFESGVSSDGRRFVAMECVNGEPLDRFVRTPPNAASGRERTERMLRLCAAIASAVGHAHANGVIHRDLKPSNILVDAAGQPHVLDFGLARELDGLSDRTMTSDFAGTPAYAAPEQFESDPALIDARTDVYSLGVIMYQTLTGTHPYPCDGSLPALMEHVRTTIPQVPSRRVPHLSTDIDTIVLKALSKEPERRYRNGEALAADIQDCLSGLPISARRDSTLYVLRKLALRHRIPVAIGGAALVTIIAATVALALLSNRLDAQRRSAEAALAESTLQRARLLAKTGNSLLAEQILWRSAIEAGVVAADGLGLEGEPLARKAAWGLLELYAKLPKRATFETGSRVAQFSFEPDGLAVRTTHADGSLQRWSLTGQRLSGTTGFLPSRVSLLSVSRDHHYAVALEADGSLSAYDLEARVLIAGPQASPHRAPTVIISEDGAVFLCTSDDGAVRLYDTFSLTVLKTFDTQFVRGTISGDTLVLAVESGECSDIELRSLDDFRLVSTLRVRDYHPDVRQRYAANVSSDGRYVLVSNEAHLYLYDQLRGGDPIAGRGGYSPLGTAAFYADGQCAVSLTFDGTLTNWSIPGLERLRVLRIGPGNRQVEVLGKSIATCQPDGSLAIWPSDEMNWPTRLSGSQRSMHALALSADESILAVGDDHGWLTLRHASDGSASAKPIRAHRNTVKSIEYSPDGDRILTAGTDGAVREWTAAGAAVRDIAVDLGNAQCARYGPDGQYIAGSANDGSVYLWSGRDRLARRTLGSHGTRVPQVEFSRDGRLLASLSDKAGAAIWDVRTGDRLRTLRHSSIVSRAMAFSPDGTTLAIGDDSSTICFWDVQSGELLRTFSGLPWGPFDMKYHPSGRVLFAVGRGGEIIVVDPISCSELAAFPAHEALPFALQISKDGRRLFTAGEDDWIGVWHLDQLRECAKGNAAFQRKRRGDSAPTSN